MKKLLIFLKGANDIILADEYKDKYNITIVSCRDVFVEFFIENGYRTVSNSDFLNENFQEQFDIIIGSPLFNSNTLKIFEKSLSLGKKVHLIIPAGSFMGEKYDPALDTIYKKIDKHISDIVVYQPNHFLKEIKLFTHILDIRIDFENVYDQFKVRYTSNDKEYMLDSILKLNKFGNYEEYVTFKEKVLNYIENNKDEMQHPIKKPKGKYKVEISKTMGTYTLFGKMSRFDKKLRQVTTDNIDFGVSFEDFDIANACFEYLQTPIAILAGHIYKKNMHCFKDKEPVPFFNTIEDFKNPEKVLNLTDKEIEFANHIFNNPKKYIPW